MCANILNNCSHVCTVKCLINWWRICKSWYSQLNMFSTLGFRVSRSKRRAGLGLRNPCSDMICVFYLHNNCNLKLWNDSHTVLCYCTPCSPSWVVPGIPVNNFDIPTKWGYVWWPTIFVFSLRVVLDLVILTWPRPQLPAVCIMRGWQRDLTRPGKLFLSQCQDSRWDIWEL